MVEKRNPHALYCDDPSLTQQSFKDECDVNLIVKKFKQVNGVDFLNVARGHPDGMFFGDFSNVSDYRSALEAVKNADEAFMNLDRKVRERFSHDPAQFLEFVSNPENVNEMIALGLATRRDVPKETSDAQKPA